jgi:glycerol-3-phosphate O-acyltransferase
VATPLSDDVPAGTRDGAWRLLPAEVERSPAFEAGLPALAERCGRTVEAVRREASTYLEELRTAHVPWVYARVVAAGRRLVASGYERIDYDDEQVARLRNVLARWPAVVLASHRSYLDGGALTVGFADHALPPLTVFAGANMAFWPVGAIWRRASAVFIRRARTTPVYGYALRQLVASLIERRRPLQWFLEGTRSRSGRLGAPRLGLLVYVVDAYRDGRVDDAMLVPASIAYDQLREVEEYAEASAGRQKAPETLGWLVRFVRAQRGRHGAIHVRFGDPVSLRAALGPPEALPAAGSPAMRAALEELALEVARRIEAATPITGAGLLGVALLASRGRALTDRQLEVALRGYVEYARRRGLPRVASADVDVPEIRAAVLDSLREHGVVVRSGDPEPRYAVAPGRELWAAYYRNTVVHHFVVAAVAELALLAAADSPGTAEAAFFRAAGDLHALLAEDFHLADATSFSERVVAELEALAPDWRRRLAAGPEAATEMLTRAPVLCSDPMLRPTFEAHAIVGEWRRGRAADALPDDSIALAHCLQTGRRQLAERRIAHPEAVALPLLAAALRHARRPGAANDRALEWLRAMDEVHRIAVGRVDAELAAAQAAGHADGTPAARRSASQPSTSA